MNWQILTTSQEFLHAMRLLQKQPIIIFKHSTRCSISHVAKNNLERSWESKLENHTSIFYINVIRNRDISNEISQILQLKHQSPQILIIYKEKCTLHTSHLSISYSDVKKEIYKFV